MSDPAAASTKRESTSTNVEDQATIVADRATDMEIFASRVRAAAVALDFNASTLGKRVGVPSSSASNYWNGVRPWPTEFLVALADALHTDVDALLGGRARSPIGAEIHRALAPADNIPDLVEVTEIDLVYGLGGTYSDGPVETQTLHFGRLWLQSITSSPPEMLMFARGRGDSMQPTIQDGDIVLIDRSIRTIKEQDAIWALTSGEIAMIKRLRVRGDRVTIFSDNDRVGPDDVFHEEINVVGRVIFIGRRL